ncbi:MAG: class I SAM-dependent methyltransferase [Thermoanaerobaculia bacterium]
MPAEQSFRNISDTALWAAVYRARETERPDALFRDPFARRLAGDRGREIAASIPPKAQHDWAWVMRTVLFDRFITEKIRQGVDLVLNLAAGLDARPYRMILPPALVWVEADLPDLLDYKEAILRGEKPVCELERVRVDLANETVRRDLFRDVAGRAKKALIITEGLLIYLSDAQVGVLAEDLAAPKSFQHWVLDVASPGLVRMLQRQFGSALDRAGAPLKFGPPEGPGFFLPHGWRPEAIESPLKAAARAKRLPLFLRVMAMLPDSSGRQGSRPWSGICLMTKKA